MHPRYALPVSFLLSLLAACGGGGGGGGPTDVQFTQFSAIGPNQRANMNGTSQTASGTGTPVVGGFLVNSVNLGSTDSSLNTRAQITFDGNRNISAFNFTAPQSSAGFSSGVDCSSGPVCLAETTTSAGVLGNPSFAGNPPFPAHNWNYQTYGVWVVQPSPTTFQAGAISVGAPTPGSAVPTTGNATFTGSTSGFYTENTQPFVLLATVSASVNFDMRLITFSTSNTTIGNLNSGAVIPQPDLNLTAGLNYGENQSQFTGNVSTTALVNPMTGTATGRFYGPAAQEMGGVYSLTGNNARSLVGAFGARRP